MRPLTRALTGTILLSVTVSAGAVEASPSISTGTYVGDGSPVRVIDGGFSHDADVVIIKSEDGGEAAVIATTSFPVLWSKKLGDNDSFFLGGIQSLNPGGFTIGLHNTVNRSGRRFHWIAIDTDGIDSRVGSYTGSGTPTQDVTGVGFQPDYVLVMSSAGDPAVHRSADMPESFELADTGLLPNRITGFLADGFQVGNAPTVNAAGVTYYLVAMKRTEGFFDFGTYTGDDTDDRDLPFGILDPSFMFTKGSLASPCPIRFGHQVYDASIQFDRGPVESDRIQDMVDDQFQLGTRPEVNLGGESYYWAAWGTSRPCDLWVKKTVDDETPAERDVVTYEVVVENLGPGSAEQIVISDVLPAELNFASALYDARHVRGGGRVVDRSARGGGKRHAVHSAPAFRTEPAVRSSRTRRAWSAWTVSTRFPRTTSVRWTSRCGRPSTSRSRSRFWSFSPSRATP